MSHRQQLLTSSAYCCCCAPEFDSALLEKESRQKCSRFAGHALHPGAVTARLGLKQGPRAARAEAARAGRWWPWLDSNGFTLFAQQYDRGICCELLLYKYLVPGTWHVLSPYHTKKMKCLVYIEPHIRFYTRTRKFQKEVTIRRGKTGPFLNLRNLACKRPITNALTQTHICARKICVRNSRERVFESDVRNMRVRSSYTRTGYRGGQ